MFRRLKRKRLYRYAKDIASQRSLLRYLEYFYFLNPQKFTADNYLMRQVEKCKLDIKNIEANYYSGGSLLMPPEEGGR